MVWKDVASTLVISFITGACFAGTFAKYTLDIFPKDINACPNQIVNYTCSLTDPEHRSPGARMGFEVLEVDKFVAVDGTDVATSNETTSRLVYSVMPGSDYRYIRCYYGHSNSSRLAESPTVTALLYTRPEKVKEFKCEVFNYVESMECTWAYGIKYNVMPEVIVEWKFARDRFWQDCYYFTKQPGSCHWNSTRGAGDFSMKHISVRITLKQKCGMNVSSEFNIDTSKIVRPAPVVDLQAEVLNSTCVKLKWEASASRPEYTKQVFVRISSRWTDMGMNFSTQRRRKLAWKTICELQPYTEYTFRVLQRPFPEGIFSTTSSVTVKTYPAKPSASPLVTPGGYSWHTGACDVDGKERNVCLLWKPIADIDRNGDMWKVRVFVKSEVDNITTEWSGNTTFGCIRLRCSAAYTAYITAENKNGTSEDASELLIPVASAGDVPPKFIVEMSETDNGTSSVYVSIQETSAENEFGYTIFWCRNDHGHCSTSIPMQWKISNESEVVLNIERPTDNLYGVSANSAEGGSGVEWQNCIHSKDKEPTVEPKNVHVEPGQDDKSLVVTWDPIMCNHQEPKISNYTIEYCIRPGHLNCKYKTVAATGKSRFVLKDLSVDREYAVSVRGISKDQRAGPFSKPKYATPVHRQSGVSISIVVGIIVPVIALVVVGGVLIYRLWGRKLYNHFKDSTKITIPSEADDFGEDVSNGRKASSTSHYHSSKGSSSGDSAYSTTGSPDSGWEEKAHVALLHDTEEIEESLNVSYEEFNTIFDKKQMTKEMKNNLPASNDFISNTVTDQHLFKNTFYSPVRDLPDERSAQFTNTETDNKSFNIPCLASSKSSSCITDSNTASESFTDIDMKRFKSRPDENIDSHHNVLTTDRSADYQKASENDTLIRSSGYRGSVSNAKQSDEVNCNHYTEQGSRSNDAIQSDFDVMSALNSILGDNEVCFLIDKLPIPAEIDLKYDDETKTDSTFNNAITVDSKDADQQSSEVVNNDTSLNSFLRSEMGRSETFPESECGIDSIAHYLRGESCIVIDDSSLPVPR